MAAAPVATVAVPTPSAPQGELPVTGSSDCGGAAATPELPATGCRWRPSVKHVSVDRSARPLITIHVEARLAPGWLPCAKPSSDCALADCHVHLWSLQAAVSA
jgi:hypothetical protein